MPGLVDEHEVTLDLPQDVWLRMGQVMSIWSYAEWILSGTLCTLLRTDRKVGRELFLGSRTQQLWKNVKKLIDLHEIKVATDLASLKTNLDSGESARNLLAHGVWMVDTESKFLCIQNPSGEWKVGNMTVGSKRRYPEAFPVSEAWLTEIVKNMISWTAQLNQFDREISAAMKP